MICVQIKNLYWAQNEIKISLNLLNQFDTTRPKINNSPLSHINKIIEAAFNVELSQLIVKSVMWPGQGTYLIQMKKATPFRERIWKVGIKMYVTVQFPAQIGREKKKKTKESHWKIRLLVSSKLSAHNLRCPLVALPHPP